MSDNEERKLSAEIEKELEAAIKISNDVINKLPKDKGPLPDIMGMNTFLKSDCCEDISFSVIRTTLLWVRL